MKDIPVHVRATKEPRKGISRLFGRFRYVYDVRLRSGEVRTDVNLDTVGQGARFPSDLWLTKDGADKVAKEGAPGRWVEFPYGHPVPDGPGGDSGPADS